MPSPLVPLIRPMAHTGSVISPARIPTGIAVQPRVKPRPRSNPGPRLQSAMSSAFQPKSEFLRQFIDRGFLHQCTAIEELDRDALQGGLVAYIGFDATADSLHVGSLLQIMMLRLLQKTGGKP